MMNHGQRPVIIAVVVVLALIIGRISFLRASATNRPDIIVAKNNLQMAELGLLAAQSDLKTAQEALNRLTLIAPFDGTITAVNVDAGEATTGPVAELVTMNALEVVLAVDEINVGALNIGDNAVVTFDAWPGQQVNAKIISIAPKATALANVVNFEVHLKPDDTDLDLRAGMTANVTIETFRVTGVLLIPGEAIFTDPVTGEAYVHLVAPDGPKKTVITIGERSEQVTQVLSGLKAEDELLLAEPISK